MTIRKGSTSSPFVERVIAVWLRVGVLISIALILLGFAISFVRYPAALTDPELFQQLTAPGAIFPYKLADLSEQLLALRGRAIVTLGILVLLLTPVVRVLLSIIAFIFERDWVYVAMTTGVFVLLLISFLIGAAV